MDRPDAVVPDVVVVGGGVIGLACAWRLAQRGARVTVVDEQREGAASRAAAGMLAPVSELDFEEQDLLRLTTDSAARYPAFVAELEQATGREVGHRQSATLCVARDRDDLAVLDDLHDLQQRLGLEIVRLTRRECRDREPSLAPGVCGGLLVAGDHAVDNRRLAEALQVAVEKAAGAGLRRERVERVLIDDDRATGVQLASGEQLRAGVVLVAAGAWSGRLEGIPEPARPPVRPVKGELLYLAERATGGSAPRVRALGDRLDEGPDGPPASAGPLLEHNLRGIVEGASVYVVPRGDGRYVVGATVEEQGFDVGVTARGVWELLRDARELLPSITELEVLELVAGLRPGSPDNAPILGPTPVEGLGLATGHYRNGILLTPVTADAVADWVVDGALPELAAPFTLERFEHSS